MRRGWGHSWLQTAHAAADSQQLGKKVTGTGSGKGGGKVGFFYKCFNVDGGFLLPSTESAITYFF